MRVPVAVRALWVIPIVTWLLVGDQAEKPKRFEVASVRPTDPKERYADFRVSPGGRFTVTGWELSLLIQRAYGVKRYQILGGPAWIDTDLYDISAKASGDPTSSEMMGMLHELLAERFHLRVRLETRDVEGYALVTAKGGPKLTPAQGADREWVRRMTRPDAITLGGENAPMSLLAERLGEVLGRPVRDRSGIAGHYDFVLTFAPPQPSAMDVGGSAASIFTALQEQLGLRLEKGPASMAVLVNGCAGRGGGRKAVWELGEWCLSRSEKCIREKRTGREDFS
jgi:uncharacterized protein (TIGR03435 family)